MQLIRVREPEIIALIVEEIHRIPTMVQGPKLGIYLDGVNYWQILLLTL